MSQKILIADDEANILISLEYLMKREGYRVSVARDGEEAVAAILRDRPALVLLDAMMPKKSGFEVCQEVRANDAVKGTLILMLTAKGRDTDVAKGLGLGADAYMTKPFSTKELVARVRAVLRRARPGEVSRALTVGAVSLDPTRHAVTVEGRAVELTPKEFDLLHALLAAAGRVLSR